MLIFKLKTFLTITLLSTMLFAGGEDGYKLAVKNTGLCVGNSRNFTGLRINTVDRDIENIKGINLTLWPSTVNESGRVTGFSLGLLPSANRLNGFNFGLLGVGGNENLNGISLGVLGAGAGKNINGVVLGGLGAGSGGNINGLALGLAGVGAGGNVNGVALGGFGLGVGNDFRGIGIGGFGMGAGNNYTGAAFSLFGAGFGNDFLGLAITGFGMGAGSDLSGVMFSGFGMGAGNNIRGIAISGLGMGAGESISGIAFGGVGVGSPNLSGIMLSLVRVMAMDEGNMKGLAVSAFNKFEGSQTGVSVGIVNHTNELFGIQFGLINVVKENPKVLRILPLMNMNFSRSES